MSNYIISGDFEICGKVQTCMIEMCGPSKENAEKYLDKTLKNPPVDCLGNIHIEEVKENDCWWNKGWLD